MRPRRLGLTASLFVGLATTLSASLSEPAWAQDQAVPSQGAPSQPALTMPVIKKNEGAVYPKQALDEGIYDTVEVPLLLTVDATGVVTRAVVETPRGPWVR
jgi:hypothetical protein